MLLRMALFFLNYPVRISQKSCRATVSYKKLWVLCAEKEMSKAELRKRAGISSATFTKLRKNQEVTLSVILKIAEVLDCNAGDMMDFIKDDEYAELEDVGVEEVW